MSESNAMAEEASSNGDFPKPEFGEQNISIPQEQPDFTSDDANFGDYSGAKPEEQEQYGGNFNEETGGEEQNFQAGEENAEEASTEDQDTKDESTFQTAEIEPTGRDYTTSEYYQQMLSYGVAESVIGELIEMIDGGQLKHEEVEERLFESVKTIRPDHCAFILRRFREANLMGINNIPAYLGSLLKNFKERIRIGGEQAALAQPIISAPPLDKIKPILDRTGYPLEVTIGQRKYGGPPPDWGEAPIPGSGHELYVGKLPREVMEDELIPLFEECGRMYDLRLMMDPISGYNKGYAFVTYVDKSSAAAATQKYEGYEIRKGKRLRVNVSIANTRLFIGNIPKSKGKDEIFEEFTKVAELEGVTEVIIYASPDDPERKKNRGFCFLEFTDHRAASQAKRRLATGRIRPWNGDVVVDWAEPQEEPDEETMSHVKVVYVKPLKETVTEDELKEQFSAFGDIERVKKIKDYAFVHFQDRTDALKAIEGLHNKELFGELISCSLARPQMDRKKRHDVGGRGAMGANYGGFPRGRGTYMGGRGAQGAGAAYPYYGRGGGGGGYAPRGGGGGGYGYGGAMPSYYGGGEYDYAAADPYGGYDYGGYGGETGGDWYDQQQAYAGYYSDPAVYGQAPIPYQAAPAQPFRGARAMPRAGPRGRGGVPIRGRGGQTTAPARGGYGTGGGGGRGFSPRGGAPTSSGGGARGFRGGQAAGPFPMKRKSDFDNGGAKRRPGGGRGGGGGFGRGGWGSRGAMASSSYQQGWATENFAEDSYS